MAAASHFSARIYGEVQGNPPFQNGSGKAAFSLVKDHPAPQVGSFPGPGVNIWGLPNGYQMANGAYVYSVIEVQASGLQAHTAKYVSDQSAASLATLIG